MEMKKDQLIIGSVYASEGATRIQFYATVDMVAQISRTFGVEIKPLWGENHYYMLIDHPSVHVVKWMRKRGRSIEEFDLENAAQQ